VKKVLRAFPQLAQIRGKLLSAALAVSLLSAGAQPVPECFRSIPAPPVPVRIVQSVVDVHEIVCVTNTITRTNTVAVPDDAALTHRAVAIVRDPARPAFVLLSAPVPTGQVWRIECRLPSGEPDQWFPLQSSTQSGGTGVTATVAARNLPYTLEFRARRIR
jgi:hypothetical protein